MTVAIESLAEILDDFDVAVLDQWGVMHNGSTAYPYAVQAMELLARAEKQILVLSNSGKRADLNLARIADMHIPVHSVTDVITSGEALWQDLHEDRLVIESVRPRRLFPICGKNGDAQVWAAASQKITIVDDVSNADAIMLMGLPDGSRESEYDSVFSQAIDCGLPLICSNPDKKSPREGGLVISPGILADRYAERGGKVVWYGKPHFEVFQALIRCCPDVSPERFLMVGDSMEHDIAGAERVGFSSVLVRGGIHCSDFENAIDNADIVERCDRLASEHQIETPSFTLPLLA